ncbi:MAG: hypothetical protein V3W34_09095 [Phycisphaerae bacterium]
MFHFCIFGSREGELTPDQKVCITAFGACELRRPTLAKLLIESRQRAKAGLPKRTHFFITICGATELKLPTLAEEYLAMQEAVNSGVLTVGDWDAAMTHLSSDDVFQCDSLTIMGGFGSHELPAENEEVDGLALNRHLGHIPEQAGQMLELGVGQRGSQRAAIVRQAFATTALATA